MWIVCVVLGLRLWQRCKFLLGWTAAVQHFPTFLFLVLPLCVPAASGALGWIFWFFLFLCLYPRMWLWFFYAHNGCTWVVGCASSLSVAAWCGGVVQQLVYVPSKLRWWRSQVVDVVERAISTVPSFCFDFDFFFFFFNSAGAAVSQVFWCGGSAEGHSRLLMCALHIVLEAVVQWWRREFFLCCGATERLWESTQWQQSGSVWIGSFVLFFSFCAILCSDSTRVAPFPYVFSCASMRYDKAVWWEATEGSLLQHHSRIW